MQATTVSHIFDEAVMAHCRTEYFPVAPIFFTKELKFKLLALYQFARVTDNISDDSSLSRETRYKTLKSVDQMLESGDFSSVPDWLKPFCILINDGNIERDCGHKLLSAFMQDLNQDRFKDWISVLDYCERSAVPIGRAILRIFKEKAADIKASDNLCYTLQILNHVKDMKSDFKEHGRVYFPEIWYENVGDLAGSESTVALIKIRHRILDEVDKMLDVAENLPRTVNDLRLRAFYIYTVQVARRVAEKLRATDPLKEDITIGTWEKLEILGKTSWQLAVCRKQK